MLSLHKCTKMYNHTIEPHFRIMYSEKMLDQKISYSKWCTNYGNFQSSKKEKMYTISILLPMIPQLNDK